MNPSATYEPTGTATATPARSGWWQTPFRTFQTNLREIDADLDVERVLDAIQDFGADTWLLNAGGILAFHPTDLPFQTRNPHLAERPGGDLLGDAVRGAHRRGLRVLARMDFSKVSEAIAREHPEWCFVDAAGEQQVFEGQVSVCPSGEYYQHRTADILDEVIDRYPVDGFFFNMFGFNEVDYSGRYRGVCQGESCRRAFAAWSGGLDLPDGPDSPRLALWRAWCAEVVTELGARIRARIAERRPEAALILRQSADVLFDEANNAVGRELWHHQTGESVSALRTSRPDLPMMENCVSFVDMPYRMAGEEPEHVAQYLIQTLARGGNPSTYIMGVPGDIDYPSLEAAAQITRFHRDHAERYRGLRPASLVGLVRPHGSDPGARREFRGLYSALQEGHVPFDVVPQEHLPTMHDAGLLSRFRLLLLPDLRLTEDQASALDTAVDDGLHLVLTGRSAFTDEDTPSLRSAPTRRRHGTVTGEKPLQSTYVAAADGVHERGVRGPVLPVWGDFHRVEPAAQTEVSSVFLPQAPYGPPEKAYGHRPSTDPGRVLSGDGRVTLVPWTLGAAHHHLGLSVLREQILDVVREHLPDPAPVSAELPRQVELTVMESPEGGLVVHLINLTGRQRTSFAPPVPVHGGRLHLRGLPPDVRVRALRGGEAPTAHDGRTLTVTVPTLQDFEVLVIEPADDLDG